MVRNFLKGSYGDAVNVMLAASAMNFKRMMNLWKAGRNILAQPLNEVLTHYFLLEMDAYKLQSPKCTF